MILAKGFYVIKSSRIHCNDKITFFQLRSLSLLFSFIEVSFTLRTELKFNLIRFDINIKKR